MDPLERALEESGDYLDLTIRKLAELQLEPNDQSACSVPHQQVQEETCNENLPKDCADCVECLVKEMMSASDIDNAKSRASRLLQVLENSIYARASSDAAQSFRQKSEAVKGKAEVLVRENTILKRLVAIQHESQKGLKNTKLELSELKKLITQYQGQLRTLELKNYALNLHLKQALNSNSIPGHFHPTGF